MLDVEDFSEEVSLFPQSTFLLVFLFDFSLEMESLHTGNVFGLGSFPLANPNVGILLHGLESLPSLLHILVLELCERVDVGLVGDGGGRLWTLWAGTNIPYLFAHSK